MITHKFATSQIPNDLLIGRLMTEVRSIPEFGVIQPVHSPNRQTCSKSQLEILCYRIGVDHQMKNLYPAPFLLIKKTTKTG
ncbi:MAG: hypothetical protein ABJI80_00090, partial [Roseibium sp.]